MKRFIITAFFIAATLSGCASNYYNVPAETVAEKVKVLGIAPILIDAESDILHPQKDLLIPLVAELNRKYEPLLAGRLRSDDNFYAVRPLSDEPQQLFKTLVSRREKRDDADVQYNKYFVNSGELGAYLQKNRLDAVMVVVVSGLTRTNKIYSSNLLTSLETNYNYLMLSAQILGPDGTVLWEYPNFRGRLLSYYPLVNLQYPDFSESEANLSKKTEVRFKSLDGIRRTLEKKRSDWLLRETQEPEAYGRLFDEMASVLAVARKGAAAAGEVKPGPAAENALKPVEQAVPAAAASGAVTAPPQTPLPVVEPPVKPPVQMPTQPPVPTHPPVPPASTPADSYEIVPATGSTL